MQIPSHFALIPGYADAVIREGNIRDAALLNLTTRICGVKIRQMTLRHWLILNGIDSPLLGGHAPDPDHAHIERFLWVLSPRFGRNLFTRRWFCRKVRKLPYGELIVRIRQFVADTFQDANPSSETKWAAPQISFAVNIIHQLATEFNWPREAIMALPLKEIFQYLKISRMIGEAKCGNKPVGWNPSDAILIRETRKRRAEIKAQRKETVTA